MKSHLIFAKEATAARLLDMGVEEFRNLVHSGHLPKPTEIAPGVSRWSADDIKRLGSGDKIDGMEDVDW
ncbi:hypothetical protein BFP70_01305 [Thioclava sp. SK-1]|uniref:hypothetical protein n=1 Tax=Thioclava sp. SK-1 TaxID=1889770 RepID=UPI0008243507|nr:hypothetical protein [Thioclava sp. SK-1]OCX64182.1 hypothetical protein BFP70_01305 [Thioclava sp. SK-1]